MKTATIFFLSLLILLGLSNCTPAPSGPQTPAAAPPLLISLTSDPAQDPHSVLMGLHLAQHMQEKGMTVTVFLNVHGVNLLRPGAAEVAFDGEKLQGLLTSMIGKGVTVLACPHCMKLNGLTEADLLTGITMSDHDKMASQLAQGPTVFTY